MTPARSIVGTLLEDDFEDFDAKEDLLVSGPYGPGGEPIRSSNLGWLLRHWQQVESFDYEYRGGQRGSDELRARLRDGRVYATDFADLTVCFHWLNRPTFQGLPLTVNQTAHWTIGSPAYKRVWKAAGNGVDGYRAQVDAILRGE